MKILRDSACTASQLRGSCGRGRAASHCVLLYKAPLGQQGKEPTFLAMKKPANVQNSRNKT